MNIKIIETITQEVYNDHNTQSVRRKTVTHLRKFVEDLLRTNYEQVC